MTPIDVLRSITEAEIGREIIRLVPHWYEAECGPEEYSIPIGPYTARFYNHSRLPPNLSELLARICARTQELPLDRFMEYAGATDVLVESFATEWLRMQSRELDWVKLIKYLETVSRRTSENLPVALTLIVRPGTGIGDITQPHLQKFFDRLAASPYTFTYLAVDADLRLMNYGSVEWSQVNNATSHKFYPEFLHPIHSVMEDTDLVAHLTPHGDLVIMDKAGVLATKRKKKWRIYDARQFKSSLAYCLGNRDVAANLIEVVFDLSFKRQGALLVYDPEHRILERILNPESIMSRPLWKRNGQLIPDRPCGQVLVGSSIEDIAIGKKDRFHQEEEATDRIGLHRRRDCLRRHQSLGDWGIDPIASRRRKPLGSQDHRRKIGISLGCAPHCREFRWRRDGPFPESKRRRAVRCGNELPVACSHSQKASEIQASEISIPCRETRLVRLR